MRVRNNWNIVVALATCGLCTSTTAQSAQSVTAGELVVEPPTLIALGFEWTIEGDDNRNARVAIAYRREGRRASGATGLPLLRLQNERRSTRARSTTPRRTCSPGSVFDLAENTEYEVRLTLTDPDGVER